MYHFWRSASFCRQKFLFLTNRQCCSADVKIESQAKTLLQRGLNLKVKTKNSLSFLQAAYVNAVHAERAAMKNRLF